MRDGNAVRNHANAPGRYAFLFDLPSSRRRVGDNDVGASVGQTLQRDLGAGLIGVQLATAAYAERNGIPYSVQPEHVSTPKRSSYPDNFRSDRKTPWTH